MNDTETLSPSDSASQRPPSKARSNRSRRKPPASKANDPPRVPVPTGPLPPPSHLSTSASPLRNDPFVVDEFCVDGFDLRPTELRPELSTTCSGFMDLVEITYSEMTVLDRYFEQSIPFSLYSYTCVQLLHARLNELEKQNRRPYDLDFDSLMMQHEYYVPEPISLYLKALGEFSTPDGEIFRPAPTPVVTATGDFGQYGPATSVAYQAVPAPLLSVELMQADTTVPHVPMWIPNGVLAPVLRPNHGSIPNRNLLGWFPSTAPSPRSIPVYARLGITPLIPPPDLRGKYLTSIRILDYVSSYLSLKSSVYRVSDSKQNTPLGSSIQIPYMTPLDVDIHPRGSKYSLSDLKVVSSFKLPARITSASFMACTRIEEIERANGTLPYLGYTWHNAAAPAVEVPPPAGYAAVRNSNFTSVDSVRLNRDYFDTNYASRYKTLADAVRHFRVDRQHGQVLV